MPEQRSSLVIDVRPGERLELADIAIDVVHKSGQAARLRVTAPREVRIKKSVAAEHEDARPFVGSTPT